MDFLGNISLRLIGLLVTVGTLAAIYFFIVKPATDTANKGIDATNRAIGSISEPLKQAEQQQAEAQMQLQQALHNGETGAGVDLTRLQKCVQKAHQDVNKLNRCVERFGPN
jgi:F0F1-type ATP synthase membrane subunit b/b'